MPESERARTPEPDDTSESSTTEKANPQPETSKLLSSIDRKITQVQVSTRIAPIEIKPTPCMCVHLLFQLLLLTEPRRAIVEVKKKYNIEPGIVWDNAQHDTRRSKSSNSPLYVSEMVHQRMILKTKSRLEELLGEKHNEVEHVIDAQDGVELKIEQRIHDLNEQ
uniref:Ty3-gypsy retrotransposon protein n=1 Tax=Haemonchus contortus TaxID=6289 RepID=A0A7I5ECK9_HAECO